MINKSLYSIIKAKIFYWPIYTIFSMINKPLYSLIKASNFYERWPINQKVNIYYSK